MVANHTRQEQDPTGATPPGDTTLATPDPITETPVSAIRPVGGATRPLNPTPLDPPGERPVSIPTDCPITQQLAADTVSVGTFQVQLYDEEGLPIDQGKLSHPLTMMLVFDGRNLPGGGKVSTVAASYHNRQLDAGKALSREARSDRSQPKVDNQLVVLKDQEGLFAITAQTKLWLYMPMVMR